MQRTALLVLALALAGCEDKVADSSTTPTGTAATTTGSTGASPVDADGDGYTDDVDCDDTRIDVNPDADERCNGIDDNCDGVVDTDAIDRITTYADLDGDGSGDDATATEECTLGPGRVQLGGDCNDSHPGLNARDDDADGASTCDGDCDDADPALNLLDADLDGYDTCSGDCDDADDTRSPYDSDADGQSGCDGDCDDTDPTREGLDVDGDGFSTCDGDCDDTDDTLELTDLDGDTWTTCDGDCDDHNPGLNLTDADGDTWSTCAGDCDDADATKSPSDVDLDGQSGCDGDCDDTDGTIDTLDTDADGWTSCDGDCDDANPDAWPGATETCDLADRDCDGDATAGAVDATWWFIDIDGDGFGVSLSGQLACSPPSAVYVDQGGDCNDNQMAVNPAMPEDCADGVDNDCSGVADDCDPGGGGRPFSALDADRRWDGVADGRAGETLTAADLDGDGIDDLLAGAPLRDEASQNDGRAWLLYGAPSLASSGPLDGAADAVFRGSDDGGRVGNFMANVGDMDGDGIEELAFGIPYADAPPLAQNNGDVRLLYGSTTRFSGVLDADASGTSIPGVQSTFFGPGLAGVGDIDGDAFDDLLVTAPSATGASGSGAYGVAYIVLGGPTRGTIDLDTVPTIEGTSNYRRFCNGEQCATGGDFDGDGFGDIAIGGEERTALLYGDAVAPTGSILNTSLPGIPRNGARGTTTSFGDVMTVLDFDGDGFDDLAISDRIASIESSQDGTIWVFLGGNTRWTGDVPLSAAAAQLSGTKGGVFGESMAALPDVDGDGDDELICGAIQDDGLTDFSGAVYGFVGSPSPASLTQWDADYAIAGVGLDGRFGSAVAVGDFDGDGNPDLAVGASDEGLGNNGRVYLFSNPF